MMFKLLDLAEHKKGTPIKYHHGWVPIDEAAELKAQKEVEKNTGLDLDSQMSNATSAAHEAKEPDGGFSFNPHTGKSPNSGFMVSLKATKTSNLVVDHKALNGGHIIAHARANEAVFRGDPDLYQGGWHDPETGLVHLDISRNVKSKKDAIKLAKKNNQISIFDLKTFKSIATGGTGSGGVQLSNKTKSRTLLTPVQAYHAATLDLSDDSGLTYWKEVLPETSIEYEGQTITFDNAYLKDLAQSFKDGAYDQTPFMLANKDNEHTMDPERYRGDIVDMQVGGPEGEPGLWSKIRFASKDAAASVLSNPKLGVSARIKEQIRRADGRSFKRAIVHVLGTLDPRVTGMSPWRAVELSSTDSDTVVLDMTSADFSKGKAMPKQKKAKFDADTDFESLSPEELDEAEEYFAKVIADLEAQLEDDDDEDDDEDEDEDEEADELVGSGALLSNSGRKAIDLANANASTANDRANEALRRMAAAEWAAERISLIDAGVPPAMVDLSEPVLNRPDQMVIDLSNTDGKGKTLDVSKVVRELLAGFEGMIDLSSEQGHVKPGDNDEKEDAILAQAKANGGF